MTQDPASIENPRDQFEAEIYSTKPAEYGMPEADRLKGFAVSGWSVMMTVWEIGSQLAVAGEELTPEAFDAAIAATENQHAFGSTPLSCATAPTPYVASLQRHRRRRRSGTARPSTPSRSRFTGIDLVAGTELRPGPGLTRHRPRSTTDHHTGDENMRRHQRALALTAAFAIADRGMRRR